MRQNASFGRQSLDRPMSVKRKKILALDVSVACTKVEFSKFFYYSSLSIPINQKFNTYVS